MKEFVVGLMFSTDRTQIALVHKNRPTWQKGHLNGIGGRIEAYDKTPAEAMAREFEEEAGITTTADAWQLLDVEGAHIHFFRTFNDGVAQATSKTGEEIVLHNAKDLPKNLLPGMEWLIPMGLDLCVNKPAIITTTLPQK